MKSECKGNGHGDHGKDGCCGGHGHDHKHSEKGGCCGGHKGEKHDKH